MRLLTDQALREGPEDAEDGLGFQAYANVLAKAALGTPGPFTIGVFGEWGTGKTSLMRLTQAALEENGTVATVWFNAWRYEREEQPIVPLVGTIVRALERQKSFLGHLEDHGRSLLRSLRAIAYGFSGKAKIQIPGFSEIEAGFVAKDMIDRADRLAPDPLLDRSLYYEAFESLSAVKLPEGTKVVIIIDDLDRCFPDKAIMLLENIKLVLSQKGFIFVLGVARKIVEDYLKHTHKRDYGIDDFQGNFYLDKIVQLPFHIPPHVGRIRSFTASLLKRLDGGMADVLKAILPVVASASAGNPRTTIRFVNNLIIDIGINDDLSKKKEMAKIPASIFAVSRCLQYRWYTIYTALVLSRDLCQAVSALTEEDEVIEAASSGSPQLAAVAAEMLREPDLRTLLVGDQGREWLTNAAFREAATHFLRTERQNATGSAPGDLSGVRLLLVYDRVDRNSVLRLIVQLRPLGVTMASVEFDPTHPNASLTRLQDELEKSHVAAVCVGSAAGRLSQQMSEIDELRRESSNHDLQTIIFRLPGSDPELPMEDIPRRYNIWT